MGYVATPKAEVGTTVGIDTGRAELVGVIVPLPFYKRG